jgi:hypothetical protein
MLIHALLSLSLCSGRYHYEYEREFFTSISQSVQAGDEIEVFGTPYQEWDTDIEPLGLYVEDWTSFTLTVSFGSGAPLVFTDRTARFFAAAARNLTASYIFRATRATSFSAGMFLLSDYYLECSRWFFTTSAAFVMELNSQNVSSSTWFCLITANAGRIVGWDAVGSLQVTSFSNSWEQISTATGGGQVHHCYFSGDPKRIYIRVAASTADEPFTRPFSFAIELSASDVPTSGGVLWTVSHGSFKEWTDRGELVRFAPNTYPAAASEDDFVFGGWVPKDPLWEALAEASDVGQWIALAATVLLVVGVFVFLLIVDVFKRKKQSELDDGREIANIEMSHSSDEK